LICVTTEHAAQNPPRSQYVSLVALIANPERFDGKPVVVSGYLTLENEGPSLFMHKEDYDNLILTNALWLEPTRNMLENREKLEFKYVVINGIFHAGHRLRNNYSAGGLTNIEKCTLLSDPWHPMAEKIREALKPH
jgi:hypothetical protein